MTTDQIKSHLHAQVDGLTFDEAHSLWSALDEFTERELSAVPDALKLIRGLRQEVDNAHANEREQFEDIAMLRKKLSAGWVK